jgi:hypothetical protein
MNWGKATVLILIVFVLFIGSMSVYMFRSPKDDYDHQYYEDGINFDHDYNREAQVIKDHAQPAVSFETDSIKFSFPQIVDGKVKLIRPSSDAVDKTFPLEGRVVAIPVSQLIRGKWKLVFEWKSNNKAYLYNTEIFVK